MNYIREINAFYDHMERNPLSASAVTLWHALMHINNKAMWAESFTVAGGVLKLKSGLTDSSFKRARKELVDAGYIEYQPSKSRKAPTYRMISLCKNTIWDPTLSSHGEVIDQTKTLLDDQNGDSSKEEELVEMDASQGRHHTRDEINHTEANHLVPNTDQIQHQSDMNLNTSQGERHISNESKNGQTLPISTPGANQTTTPHPFHSHTGHTLSVIAEPSMDHTMSHMATRNTDHHVDHDTNHNVAPLYKLNINKKRQNKTASATAASPALAFYENNFGELRPFISNGIHHWSHQLGDELVIKAMTRALEHDVPKWRYIETILQSWWDNGITTLEDVRLEELEFKGRKKLKKRSLFDELREGSREENVPDWFEERKRQNAREVEIKRWEIEKDLERVKEPDYANATREELEGLLKGFGS